MKRKKKSVQGYHIDEHYENCDCIECFIYRMMKDTSIYHECIEKRNEKTKT